MRSVVCTVLVHTSTRTHDGVHYNVGGVYMVIVVRVYFLVGENSIIYVASVWWFGPLETGMQFLQLCTLH